MSEQLKKYTPTGADRIFMKIWRLEKAIKERFEKQQKKIMEMWKELQKRCPHKGIRYNYDPCGGSDSYYSCDTCRGEWKHKPEGCE